MSNSTEAQSKTKAVSFGKEPKIVNSHHNLNSNNELWLEKFKPKKYDDLLTDEKTNRDILTWLKSWDEIVFKKKNKVNLIEKYEIKKKENDKIFGMFNKNNSHSVPKFKLTENELTYLKNKV